MTRRALYLAAAVVILALDQVSKRWAASTLKGGDDIDLLDGLLRLTYAENPGIAFSFFNSGDAVTRWILASVSTAAVVVVAYYLLTTSPAATRVQITLALLLGGIAGNLVDRVAYGRVIDFIDVYWRTYHWPTFNVADAAISVGAVLLAFELLRSEVKGDEPESEARPDA